MLFSLQALALDSSPTHRRVLLRGEGSPQARDHTHRTVFRRRAGAVPVPHAPPERGTMGHRSVGHCNRHHPDHVDSPHSPPRPRAALPDLVAAVFRTGALLPEEVARQRRASLGAEAHRLMPHTPDRALALQGPGSPWAGTALPALTTQPTLPLILPVHAEWEDSAWREETGWTGTDLCHSPTSPTHIVAYWWDPHAQTLTGLVRFNPNAGQLRLCDSHLLAPCCAVCPLCPVGL